MRYTPVWHCSFHLLLLAGFMMRSALIEQIARKSLRLSPRSRIEYTNGRQITAISADASYAEWCFPIIVQGVVAPITIVVAFILLLHNLGPSALVVRPA